MSRVRVVFRDKEEKILEGVDEYYLADRYFVFEHEEQLNTIIQAGTVRYIEDISGS